MANERILMELKPEYQVGQLTITGGEGALTFEVAPFLLGPMTQVATISSDPGNNLTLGQDGNLFVGDPPLASAHW